MNPDLQASVMAVGRIESVPKILDVVSRVTGLRFVAVARVTEDRWIACQVRDDIAFGLKPGGELKVETTLCHEVRAAREVVIIENVAEDAVYCNHPTARMYGFQSYLSIPIVLSDGRFFGTLCAIDPKPAALKSPEMISMLQLFAELIATHLDLSDRLEATETILIDERRTSQLREQLIAVLGHDLRNPLTAIDAGAHMLLDMPLGDRAMKLVGRMANSAKRMSALINDVLDFARGRMGGGLTIERSPEQSLEPILMQVVAELRAGWPGRKIDCSIDATQPVSCDADRLSQMLSNLLGNALTYGANAAPIRVRVAARDGLFSLSVANAGDPIPPDTLARLFQPFERGARNNQQGLGLGLYIAAEIARAHGGTLEVTSTADETCFMFQMPLETH